MMRVNAVLGKEITTRMRGWRAAAVITIYLTLLAVVSLLTLSGQNTPQSYSQSATVGALLFILLASLQMALIIFVTPASTADAISGERQRQTLELLLVTRLSSLSIVLGKLVAGLAFDVLLILCSLPLFSLVFLFGGVDPGTFVSVFAIFLASTLLIGSMSLFISTIMRRSSAAVIVSLLATLALTVGVLLLSLYLIFSVSNNGGGSGGSASFPFVAYLDPLIGFIASVFSTGGIFQNTTYFTGGPLNLSFWADQAIVDVLLSALFILGSVRLLRPRWSPRQQRAARPVVAATTTGGKA